MKPDTIQVNDLARLHALAAPVAPEPAKCPSCGAPSEVNGFVCVDCYYSEPQTGELSTDYVKGFADGQAALHPASQPAEAVSERDFDECFRKVGLLAFAYGQPQNLAMLRGLCWEVLALAGTQAAAEPVQSDEPAYTLDEIADACVYAEISDSKFERLSIELESNAKQHAPQAAAVEPAAQAEQWIDDDELNDLSYSACDEAFSFGLSHDVFLRYFKTIRDRFAALAAQPPVEPAAQSADRDAYEGAREDLLDWKKRALEAEDLVRKFTREVNGSTFMGEPAAQSDDWFKSEVIRAGNDGYAQGLIDGKAIALAAQPPAPQAGPDKEWRELLTEIVCDTEHPDRQLRASKLLATMAAEPVAPEGAVEPAKVDLEALIVSLTGIKNQKWFVRAEVEAIVRAALATPSTEGAK